MDALLGRPLDLVNPLEGPWTVRHSPADRVPSHGTTAFATALSVDLVPVDARGRSGRITPRTWIAPERPERFPGFGRAVLAPCQGTVVSVTADLEDHAAYRGLPSVGYALTQRRRAADGWGALAGNHVVIRAAVGPVVALCHLQQHSVRVRPGDRVDAGVLVAGCGNSGNSTEPHLHLQAMTDPDPSTARPVGFTLHGRMPRNGEIVAG